MANRNRSAIGTGPAPLGAASDTGPSGLGAVIAIIPWFAWTDQAGMNVIHYSLTGLVGPMPSWASILNAWNAKFQPLYSALMGTDTIYAVTGFREETPSRTATGWIDAQQLPGTGGGIVGPPQVASLITKRTQAAIRGNRGRLYVPWVPLNALVGGSVLSGAYQTKLVALRDGLQGGVVAPGAGGSITLSPVVYHRATKTATAISSHFAHAAVATQRRRNVYAPGNPVPAPTS